MFNTLRLKLTLYGLSAVKELEDSFEVRLAKARAAVEAEFVAERAKLATLRQRGEAKLKAAIASEEVKLKDKIALIESVIKSKMVKEVLSTETKIEAVVTPTAVISPVAQAQVESAIAETAAVQVPPVVVS